MSKEMSIKDRMKAIDYVPADPKAWAAKTEKEQHEILVRKENEREMVAARATIRKFAQTKEYAALPEDVRNAITRACGKSGGGSGGGRKNPFMDTLRTLFPKAGTTISELDIFKATKMGRGEFRKRVREALKSAAPAERIWVEFNEDKESWVLLSVGADQPKGWLGKAIDEPAADTAKK